MGERIQIPDELAASVLYASDRTCCVCRLEKTKVQIHHIDEDPSNNSFENLAVICLNCHSDAHTHAAFVRNLTPQLIGLYNTSWRDVVKLKLNPHQVDSAKAELTSEILVKITSVCWEWRSDLLRQLQRPMPVYEPEFEFFDPTIFLSNDWSWLPEYSETDHARLSPLFQVSLDHLLERFAWASQRFADVLPYEIRLLLLRVEDELRREQSMYRSVPRWAVRKGTHVAEPSVMFRHRFLQVLRSLSLIQHVATIYQEQMTTTPPIEADP
jgi:hypothetical protein